MIEHHSFNNVKVSAFQVPKAGNDLCGDSFFFYETSRYFICALADGLGSGSLAKDASKAAMRIVEEHHDEEITSIMERCNTVLRQTRGAVLAVVKFDFETQTVHYASVGNIRFMLAVKDEKVVHPLSTLGFLAGKPQKFKIQQFSFKGEAAFMLYSDGMEIHTQSRNILSRMISPEDAVFYISQLPVNTSDDATCLVGRIRASE
ncbi:PP2C family serine/threonine-protein phosphatase [Fictibacillus iocasae]|uniref:PP2C family serine/threonine-protein phosphatase n=1 Tax=Fictibacillus iocasae TaxID=2715437 RepID=A0ABW2NT64_9BACL